VHMQLTSYNLHLDLNEKYSVPHHSESTQYFCFSYAKYCKVTTSTLYYITLLLHFSFSFFHFLFFQFFNFSKTNTGKTGFKSRTAPHGLLYSTIITITIILTTTTTTPISVLLCELFHRRYRWMGHQCCY